MDQPRTHRQNLCRLAPPDRRHQPWRGGDDRRRERWPRTTVSWASLSRPNGRSGWCWSRPSGEHGSARRGDRLWRAVAGAVCRHERSRTAARCADHLPSWIDDPRLAARRPAYLAASWLCRRNRTTPMRWSSGSTTRLRAAQTPRTFRRMLAADLEIRGPDRGRLDRSRLPRRPPAQPPGDRGGASGPQRPRRQPTAPCRGSVSSRPIASSSASTGRWPASSPRI